MSKSNRPGKSKFLILSSLVALVLMVIVLSSYFLIAKPKDDGNAESTLIAGGGLPPGCVCHSKTKGMVKMHSYFSVVDCIKCHLNSENLMQRGEGQMTIERKRELEARIKSEEICQECHIKGRIRPVRIPEVISRDN